MWFFTVFTRYSHLWRSTGLGIKHEQNTKQLLRMIVVKQVYGLSSIRDHVQIKGSYNNDDGDAEDNALKNWISPGCHWRWNLVYAKYDAFNTKWKYEILAVRLIVRVRGHFAREVKLDVYGKRQTAKIKLLPFLFGCVYSWVKLFVFAQ